MGSLRAGLVLLLTASVSGELQGWTWRQTTAGTEELQGWPVVEGGQVHVCSATLNYILPDTLTYTQDIITDSQTNQQFILRVSNNYGFY